MSDTTLISFLNNLQVQGVQSVSAVRSIVNIPPTVITLPIGTLLSGFIAGKDNRGNTLLRTDKGDISLKGALVLELNTQIVLRVDTAGDHFKARIISVDGKTPEHSITLTTIPPSPTEPSAGAPVKAGLPIVNTEEPAFIVSTPEKTAALLKAIFLTPAPALLDIVKSSTAIPADVKIVPEQIVSGTVVTLKLVESVAPPVVSTALPPDASSALSLQPPAALPPLPAAVNSSPASSIITANIAVNTQATPPVIPQAAPTVGQQEVYNVALPPLSSSTVPLATTNVFPHFAGTTPTISPSGSTPSQVGLDSVVSSLTKTIAAGPTLTALNPPLLHAPAPTEAAISSALPRIPTEKFLPEPENFILPNAPSAAERTASAARPQVEKIPSPPSFNESPRTILRILQEGVLIGRVVGTEKSHETVVHTALGTLKLQTEVPLAKDTRLRLEIVSVQPNTSAANSQAPEENTLNTPLSSNLTTGIITDDDSALISLAALAVQSNNPLLKETVQRMVPQAGPRLAANILFFISALRGGDIRNWLGDGAVALLQQTGQKELLNKLANEFNAMRAALGDVSPLPQQALPPWQMIIFPLAVHGEMHRVRMYMKKDRDEKEKNQHPDASTRFIVEVALSSLGEMQMDGFVRKTTPHTRFDLMIRTHQPLPAHMQSDINNIFKEAAEITGFRGMVEFQVMKEFPIQPLNEMGAGTAHSIIA